MVSPLLSSSLFAPPMLSPKDILINAEQQNRNDRIKGIAWAAIKAFAVVVAVVLGALILTAKIVLAPELLLVAVIIGAVVLALILLDTGFRTYQWHQYRKVRNTTVELIKQMKELEVQEPGITREEGIRLQNILNTIIKCKSPPEELAKELQEIKEAIEIRFLMYANILPNKLAEDKEIAKFLTPQTQNSSNLYKTLDEIYSRNTHKVRQRMNSYPVPTLMTLKSLYNQLEKLPNINPLTLMRLLHPTLAISNLNNLLNEIHLTYPEFQFLYSNQTINTKVENGNLIITSSLVLTIQDPKIQGLKRVLGKETLQREIRIPLSLLNSLSTTWSTRKLKFQAQELITVTDSFLKVRPTKIVETKPKTNRDPQHHQFEEIPESELDQDVIQEPGDTRRLDNEVDLRVF